MNTDTRPTLDEVSQWLTSQPDLAYKYRWSDILTVAIIAVVVTVAGYTIFKVWKWGTKLFRQDSGI